MPSYHIKNISYKTFQHVLSRYPSTVPEKLLDLDVQRYETIPSLAICEEDGSANLTKDMIETLVEWKLCVSLMHIIIMHNSWSTNMCQKARYIPPQTAFSRAKQRCRDCAGEHYQGS